MTKTQGFGTRYDATTPNAIDKAREKSHIGIALPTTRFCLKCQQQRPAVGCLKLVAGSYLCAECRPKPKESKA